MRYLTAILLSGFLCLSSAPVDADNDIPSQLHMQADKLATLIKDSYAQEYGRKYYLWPNGCIVLYGFEGFASGNNWTQYMAVFAVLSGAEPGQEKPDYYSLLDVIKIGTKGWRAADFGKLSLAPDQKSYEMIISIDGKEVAADDPPNYPSKPFLAHYRIKPMRGERLRDESR